MPVEERERVAQPIELLDDVALPRRRDAEALRPVGARRRWRAQLDPPRRGRVAEVELGDEIAAALARFEEAFIDELPIGEHHRVAGDAEREGELSARRHARIGGEATLLDRGDDHLADLDLKRPLVEREIAEENAPIEAAFASLLPPDGRFGGEAPLGKAFASGLSAGNARAGIPVPLLWADKHVIQAKAILWFYGRSKLLS